MKNILLPTDFSENSWNAVTYAIHFFKERPCNFYLLHVNDVSGSKPVNIAGFTVEEFVSQLDENSVNVKLKQSLQRIEHLSPNTKHQFFTLAEHRSFIESIRKQVIEQDVDYIVMGTKGASKIKQSIIGSNTTSVITRVKCTMLVVPEKANYKNIDKIVFPTDYSLSYKIQSLQPISEILEQTKSNLCILHVSNKSEVLYNSQENNKSLLEEYFKGEKHDFYSITNNNVETAIEDFVDSKGVNLIVMIAKNLNYFQQLFFHSNVEEIKSYTDIPLLVLHE